MPSFVHINFLPVDCITNHANLYKKKRKHEVLILTSRLHPYIHVEDIKTAYKIESLTLQRYEIALHLVLEFYSLYQNG